MKTLRTQKNHQFSNMVSNSSGPPFINKSEGVQRYYIRLPYTGPHKDGTSRMTALISVTGANEELALTVLDFS